MNKITLSGVVPLTIKDRISVNSDIWNKDLSFEKGIFYAIKAISGSGKSTFINSLYGIRKDFDGSILLDNQEIKTMSSNDLSPCRKNEMSIVFQDLRLFGQLTAEENILLKTESKTLNETQLEWAYRLRISHLMSKETQILSYGERQRVAILRALSQNFDFLFLDEPFSHLDKENGLNAYELILIQAKEKNACIIMTSLGNETYLEADKTLLL